MLSRAERYNKIGTWTLDMICPIGAWYESFGPRCSPLAVFTLETDNPSKCENGTVLILDELSVYFYPSENPSR